MHVEVCPIGRTDPALPEAYWTEAVPLPPVPALLLTIRPPVAAYEASLRRKKESSKVKKENK